MNARQSQFMYDKLRYCTTSYVTVRQVTSLCDKLRHCATMYDKILSCRTFRYENLKFFSRMKRISAFVSALMQTLRSLHDLMARSLIVACYENYLTNNLLSLLNPAGTAIEPY